jgi:threonine aldolase
MRVDLRRDTITLPTEEMREAAFKAALGDSVYGEDKAQRELEEYAADRTGKEGALFVPSGTMGNLVSLLAHTGRGDEIIMEENAHIRTSETGGAGFVGGLMIKTVYGKSGVPDAGDVEQAIRKKDIHYPKTALICVEVPHHRYGGIVPPVEAVAAIAGVARRHSIPVHMDGARIYNGCIYLGVDVQELTGYADSVMISISKGLGAPVGSVICGDAAFIEKAKRHRKMLGGGMRQTGWLCACGLVALSDENIARLREDHVNARLLAEGIRAFDGITVDMGKTHTNYVLARTENAGQILKSLEKKGVLATQSRKNEIRFVTSREVTKRDIEYTVNCIADIMKKE